MRDIRNALELVQKNGVALGHFNVADLVLLKAVFSAAQELEVPVLETAQHRVHRRVRISAPPRRPSAWYRRISASS